MRSRVRTASGAAGVVVGLVALLGAGIVAPSAAQAADREVSPPGVAGHLSARPSAAATTTGRFVVVADRPSSTRGIQARLHGIEGLSVVEDRVSGRSITVEGDQGALDRARTLDGVADVVPEVTYSVLDTPNDPAYTDQAASMNVLRLPAAWDVTHGSPDVTVAVVDTGFAVDHPDLAGKVVTFYNSVTGGTSPADVAPPASPSDVRLHGTFVASVAAAATNNSTGLAGAGWNTSIMAVRVSNASGVMTNKALADGIDWAVTHGADVINISLGNDVNDSLSAAAVSRALAADVVVVAAAGNDGTSAKMYPAALPGVVAVGATTIGGGSRAGFSQYGSWVDVGAPGVSIIGANADYATQEDYLVGDGTSFAAPLVAGIAGLLRDFRPELDAAEVHAALKTSTNGKDYGFYSGVVNASTVLSSGFTRPGPAVDSPLAGDLVSGDVTVHVNLPGDVDADQVRASLGTAVDTAELSGGAATLHLPSFGLSGTQTLHVVACKATVCSSTGTDVSIQVDNAVPVIDSPADDTGLDADFTVSASAPSQPAVRFLADGITVLGTDTEAPFSVTVPITALSPGTHDLTAVVCNAAGTVCATGAPSAPVSVHVDRLRPTISSVKPSLFSPNGDGINDTTAISFTVDVASQVLVHIQDGAGVDVRTRDLGTKGPGTYSITWSGVDDSNVRQPSGSYTVFVDTSATVGAVELHGQASAALTLDVVAPKIASAVSTYPTVYPSNDDYRDSTTLSVTTAETTSGVTVYVYDAKGKKVWGASKTNAPAGKVGMKFTGHSSAGAKLAAGSYTYLFRVRDKAGNLSLSGKHTIKVSWKKLVDKTFTKTVTVEASLVGWTNDDDCSTLYRSDWAPGAGWWYSCGGSVLSIHYVTLPSATVMGAARVSTYAHGTSGSVATFAYLKDDDATVVGETDFSASVGTHSAGPVHVTTSLLEGRKLRWVILVTGGDEYEAKTFSVTYHYQVLV